jgi:hypothetical protein
VDTVNNVNEQSLNREKWDCAVVDTANNLIELPLMPRTISSRCRWNREHVLIRRICTRKLFNLLS